MATLSLQFTRKEWLAAVRRDQLLHEVYPEKFIEAGFDPHKPFRMRFIDDACNVIFVQESD